MKKIIITIAITLLAIMSTAFILPNIVKNLAEKALSKKLQTEVTIKDFDISYTNTAFYIKNITVKDLLDKNNSNILTLDNTKVKFNTNSLFKKTIVIESIKIENINLNLAGSINSNNLTTMLDILEQEEHVEHSNHHEGETAEEHAAHSNNHNHEEHHHHHSAELNLAIKHMHINNLNINAKIIKPIVLENKALKLSNIHVANLGTTEPLKANDVIEVILDLIYNQASDKIRTELPAQKVFEDTKKALEQGLHKSKDFIEKTFTKENLDKSKEKANELINSFSL